MRCSGFGHISYFFFHFIKQKSLKYFFQNFPKPKISDFFPEFRIFKKLPFLLISVLNFFSSQKGKEEKKLRVFFSEEKKTQCF